MNFLAIDIETFSEENLKTAGVYKYVAHPSFEILIFCYAINGGPVQVIDMTDGRGLPDSVRAMLHAYNFKKSAWNALFERTALGKQFGYMEPDQWECTMVKSSMLSLPMSLDQAGSAMELDLKKDKIGGAHLKYFCCPCKPTKANGMRTRNMPYHDLEKWAEFLQYCKRDVETEREIAEKISWFEIPEHEQRLWELDQEINDRGIFMDLPLIRNVMQIDSDFREKTIKEAISITGLANPNSGAQMLNWLNKEMDDDLYAMGIQITSLKAEQIPVLKELATGSLNSENITRVLEIRQELSKTSVKKYQAMINVRGTDGRARGLFQFYGANRTGRWAGRLVQMQNLPKTTMKLLALARETAMLGSADIFDMIGWQDEDKNPLSIPGALSQLIRTAFIPKPGHKFVVIDSSSIEARILAWLAGEEWRMEIFRTHGKIYEASASKMFNIPFDLVSDDDRGRGKVAELALGYQGGPNAMIRMDLKKKIRKLAVDKWETNNELRLLYSVKWAIKCKESKKPKLTDEELLEEFVFDEYQAIVTAWRPANKKIGQFWKDLNDAAIEVVEGQGLRRVGFIKMYMKRGALFIELPSGRCLVYLRPVVRTIIVKPKKGDPFETVSVAYMGVNQEKKTWGYEYTYGGKLAENICQAIARDCLGYWLQQTKDVLKVEICGHVHDELIIEIQYFWAEEILDQMVTIMTAEIPWAPGLPLGAKGFITDYYKKD